jgi:hypothetical protein
VENINGKMIFYSLENYFMTRAANISTKTVLDASANLNDLKVLNRNELGEEAIQFRITDKGTGVYCAPLVLGERAQSICSTGYLE